MVEKDEEVEGCVHACVEAEEEEQSARRANLGGGAAAEADEADEEAKAAAEADEEAKAAAEMTREVRRIFFCFGYRAFARPRCSVRGAQHQGDALWACCGRIEPRVGEWFKR